MQTAPQRRLLVVAALLAAGCGSSHPTAPLLPSNFRKELATTQPAKPAASQPQPAGAANVSPAPNSPLHPTPAATQPASQPVALPPGQYQTIGGIVSEVNGSPIFANRVLRQVAPELAARAREMDAEQFRKFATSTITERLRFLQRDELLFGAAERFLSEEDRRIAEVLTMQFRSKKITEAGGSIEMARQIAEADGERFEILVFERYRKHMSDLYRQRKIYPRVQISADDLRAYYHSNLQREFTELAEVSFRLIKVDTRAAGGAEKALAKAKQIRAKAAEGDFAQIARTMNDDRRLAESGGQEAPIQKGAYRLEKVEAALWQTPVGEITEPIADAGGIYIAKVESRKEGSVLPFEDRRVQAKIYHTLWSRQVIAMTTDLEQSLRQQSAGMVRESNDMLQTVIEMAMQNYPAWNVGS